jgi:hypothetical protein
MKKLFNTRRAPTSLSILRYSLFWTREGVGRPDTSFVRAKALLEASEQIPTKRLRRVRWEVHVPGTTTRCAEMLKMLRCLCKARTLCVINLDAQLA